jgi:hypothetical protein
MSISCMVGAVGIEFAIPSYKVLQGKVLSTTASNQSLLTVVRFLDHERHEVLCVIPQPHGSQRQTAFQTGHFRPWDGWDKPEGIESLWRVPPPRAAKPQSHRGADRGCKRGRCIHRGFQEGYFSGRVAPVMMNAVPMDSSVMSTIRVAPSAPDGTSATALGTGFTSRSFTSAE